MIDTEQEKKNVVDFLNMIREKLSKLEPFTSDALKERTKNDIMYMLNKWGKLKTQEYYRKEFK
jgi:hypothetical protein